jgi:hypothetical protein
VTRIAPPAPPLLRGDVEEGVPDADPRVRDEHVQAAEQRVDPSESLLHPRRIGHVRMNLAGEPLDRLLGTQRDRHDTRPLRHEPP